MFSEIKSLPGLVPVTVCLPVARGVLEAGVCLSVLEVRGVIVVSGF